MKPLVALLTLGFGLPAGCPALVRVDAQSGSQSCSQDRSGVVFQHSAGVSIDY